MQKILAIDAGGTSTRAVVVDLSGRCLGYGSAGGGNPVSAGFDSAVVALSAATEMAMAAVEPATGPVSSALIAMAGASSRMPHHRISERLAALGVRGELEVEADLLAMFHSGTFQSRGYVLVAGTGSVAARIDEGRLDLVSDGLGWLLGDTGSGYWIGHQVAWAVAASLDGRAPETALTGLLLASLHLTATSERVHGRPRVLLELIDVLYGLRPVELSRFAPLAFEASEDPLAAAIVAGAASALADTLAAVRDSRIDGPVVIGGSVANGIITAAPALSAPLKKALGNAELIPVRDGLIGAAVLGLQRAGVSVDADVFRRIGQSLAPLRAAHRFRTG